MYIPNMKALGLKTKKFCPIPLIITFIWQWQLRSRSQQHAHSRTAVRVTYISCTKNYYARRMFRPLPACTYKWLNWQHKKCNRLSYYCYVRIHVYIADFPKICVYIWSMFLMILMFSLAVIYTILQSEDAFFNSYDLVSLAVTV